MSDLKWTNVTRRLEDLVPWQRNPRVISELNAERLRDSHRRFDQPQPVLIGPDNELYDGHQRLEVWAAEYGPDLVVDCRIANRSLTEEEREFLVLYLHKGATGEFDMERLLADFDIETLVMGGFSEEELGYFPDEEEADENIYTAKIETPIYEPTGDLPALDDLYDTGRTDQLIREIQDAKRIPPQVKKFLIAAAHRHTVFHYREIADYYARADVDTQLLMENSALVIIDFARAIELGFVKVTESIAELVGEEYGGDDEE